MRRRIIAVIVAILIVAFITPSVGGAVGLLLLLIAVPAAYMLAGLVRRLCAHGITTADLATPPSPRPNSQPDEHRETDSPDDPAANPIAIWIVLGRKDCLDEQQGPEHCQSPPEPAGTLHRS